jgi:hypothetical protein
MKIFYPILILTILYSCGNSTKKVFTQSAIQKDLFDTIFNYEDIKSIDIVEIEHPMLGGIISSQTLTPNQINLFIKKLETLKSVGMIKCANKYVIRLILTNDTLRLKTCGEMISGRNKDIYYCLPNSGKIVGDFIRKVN